jgi:hypothetical protein
MNVLQLPVVAETKNQIHVEIGSSIFIDASAGEYEGDLKAIAGEGWKTDGNIAIGGSGPGEKENGLAGGIDERSDLVGQGWRGLLIVVVVLGIGRAGNLKKQNEGQEQVDD